MKTLSKHNCNRNHRNARTFLNCAVPENIWILGSGDYALIAWCQYPSISLWPTVEEAEKKKAFIDKTRCGGQCINHHEIAHVALEELNR